MENTLTAPKRIPQLQFLRFLAFLLVFLQHSSAWNVLSPPSIIGQGGMSFFFFLSGFGTGYSAPGKTTAPTPKNILLHMWRKLKKFYPLYFAAMFFGIIKSWLPYDIAELQLAAVGKELFQFLKNALLIQAWFMDGYMTYNGVGWFLSVMMFLYLFNVPGTWLLNRIYEKKNRKFILSGLFVSILALTWIYDALFLETDPLYWISIFPPSRIGEYLLGMIIGFAVNHLFSTGYPTKLNPMLFTFLEILSFVIYIFVAKLPPKVWHVPVVAWLIPNTLMLSVFALGKGFISKVFSNRFLAYLGDISSECYLIHQLIITVFATSFDVSHVSLAGDLFALFFCFVSTLLLAHLLHGGKLPKKEK